MRLHPARVNTCDEVDVIHSKIKGDLGQNSFEIRRLPIVEARVSCLSPGYNSESRLVIGGGGVAPDRMASVRSCVRFRVAERRDSPLAAAGVLVVERMRVSNSESRRNAECKATDRLMFGQLCGAVIGPRPG